MLTYWRFMNSGNKSFFYHDSPSYTENLKVFEKLEGHKGCVNTVAWDKTGTKILSGGDDAILRIHQCFSDLEKPWAKDHVYEIFLPNSRNILSAKFMPTFNNQIISASKCGSIFLVDINSNNKELNVFYKHSGPVLNLATFEDEAFNFATVSNDKTFCIFDIRESIDIPSIKMNFPCSLSAIAIHPIYSYKMAIGGSDSCVRVFDKRFLNTSFNDVAKTLKCVTEICRPLEFPIENNMSNRSPFHNYGRRYVNSVSFEPRSGNHLLVNYMYDSIYLFDTRQQENNHQSVCQTENLSPEASLFRIHYNWENTGPPRHEEENERTEMMCPPSIQSFLNNIQLNDSNYETKTDFKIESQLSSVKRYKEVGVYNGHQNCRTMIKDSKFWGTKYILSGSECGHILVWKKNSKYPVLAIQTDERVTNRIEPHPFLPIIATCGIDYNVKIIASTLQSVQSSEEKHCYVEKIVNHNERRTENAKSCQSMSMIDLLRVIRAQRMIMKLHKNCRDKKNFEWCVQRPNSPLVNKDVINSATSFVYPSFPRRVYNGCYSRSFLFSAAIGKSVAKSACNKKLDNYDEIEFHVKRLMSLSMNKLEKPYISKTDCFKWSNNSRKAASCIITSHKTFNSNNFKYENAELSQRILNVNKFQRNKLNFQQNFNSKLSQNYVEINGDWRLQPQINKSKCLPLEKLETQLDYSINYIPYRLAKHKLL